MQGVPLSAPLAAGTLPPPVPVDTIECRVEKGETISQVLHGAGVEQQEARRLVEDSRPVFNLARIQSGQTLRLFRQNGVVCGFQYHLGRDRYVQGQRTTDGGFTAHIVDVPFKMKKEMVRLRIDSNLYAAIVRSGERPELADALAAMFEYDVDFNRDIHSGDSIALYVEKKYRSGSYQYGAILAAELVNGGRKIQIFRHPAGDGSMGYFHADGSSVRAMFLRCPLPFLHVTSSFGMRHHPILGYSARHNGVDFGAPAGTPVRATADGMVQQTGYDGGRGRFVILRHLNGYTSHYFHLQSTVKNIAGGTRVEQGQVIAYVGSTGLSTGPHLHYALQKNGVNIHPLTLDMPHQPALAAALMPEFRRVSQAIGAQFSRLPMMAPALRAPARALPAVPGLNLR